MAHFPKSDHLKHLSVMFPLINGFFLFLNFINFTDLTIDKSGQIGDQQVLVVTDSDKSIPNSTNRNSGCTL